MKKKYKIPLTAIICVCLFVCLISVSSTALEDTEVINPIADFSANITIGNAPLIVLFTDQSTGSPTSMLWDFGDGTDSKHEMNATHTFTTPGTYTVTLTVTNAAGSNSVTKVDYITVTSGAAVVKPVADFYSPEVEQAPGEGVSSSTAISFIDNSTGSPTSWLWDFGDGSTSTVRNPTHTYAGDGGYIVNLTATNAAGSDTISKYGYIITGISGPAHATSFSSNVTSGNAPLTVLFHDEGSEDIISRSWSFGDNTSLYNLVEGNEGNATPYATHTYEKPGKYTVMLKVSGYGDRSIITKYNYIEVTDNLAPVAEFTLNVTSGPAPLSVLFNDTSAGSPTSWKWNFGDGIESSTRNVTHTFTKPGTYTVNLTVSNENSTYSKTLKIIVQETPNEDKVLPAANFSANVTSGYAPLSVLFTDLSQNATLRSWDIDNNGQVDSTDANFVHVYTNAGTYTVNLTVSNENGTASQMETIYVQTESSGGGSSGGGGGGGSPEPEKNVEVKELSQAFVASGKEARFEFQRNATCVVYVSFDAKKTLGKTTTIAELLKAKSSLVPELPAGEVYRFFNVWVGNGGVATPKNVENPVIGFKVEKSWLQNKSIDPASITLNRYNDKNWRQFPVNMSGEDSKYLYFTANVSGYSSFSITGKTKNAPEKKLTETSPEPDNGTTNKYDTESKEKNDKQEIQQKESSSTPGFEISYAIAGLLAVFLYRRK